MAVVVACPRLSSASITRTTASAILRGLASGSTAFSTDGVMPQDRRCGGRWIRLRDVAALRQRSALVELVARRDGKAGDGDAFVEELVVLLVGRLAADGTRRGLVVEDLAGFLREVLADVLGLGEELVQHLRVQHLGDGEGVLPFHFRRFFRRLGDLRGLLRSLGAQVYAHG